MSEQSPPVTAQQIGAVEGANEYEMSFQSVSVTVGSGQSESWLVMLSCRLTPFSQLTRAYFD